MMPAIDPSLATLLLLLLIAIVAGYIDTLVGGGGLITIPALLAAGLPPIYALGTNKLQAVAGTGTASLTLLIKRKLEFSDIKWFMLAAFVGSLVGSIAVQFMDSESLNILIPVVISLIAVYFIAAPTQTLVEGKPKLSRSQYAASAIPGIGFYDGMFGPGTGSFFVWAGVSLRGQGIVHATMIAKSLNFATNLASLIIFIGFGKVAWLVGGVMMLGQFVGASLGARTLMVVNPSALRYLVILVCFVMLGWWAIK